MAYARENGIERHANVFFLKGPRLSSNIHQTFTKYFQAVSVLRMAYPDDTAREVVRIIRVGPPTADDEVESLPVTAERVSVELLQPFHSPYSEKNATQDNNV